MTEETRPTITALAGQQPRSAVSSRFGLVIGAVVAFVLALATVLVTFAATAMTTASAATFTYDARAAGRVDVAAAEADEADETKHVVASEWTASFPLDPRGTSTTRAVVVNATNTVDDAVSAVPGGPKPTPNFKPPTNPAQIPPAQIPAGWRVREMPPTQQYPNGYWKLEKPMPNGGWQPIDPSTMKPGGRPETHVPFPPGGLRHEAAD